ncbi:LysR family transcriptional regulator, partial [Bacillus sp. JJ1532]|uniref:LysR family transcriptional regulator n=1 Tax=Bacillus sp. JJ1532 TaxID=3122958 RepID=UPI002FFE1F78
MNLRQFEYIDQIVNSGTMREAARKLFITEPTISQQMRKFEEEIGFPFFEKNGRILKLTKEGEVLLPEIQNILFSVKNLEQRIREISNPLSGQIHLGIGPLSAIRYLPKLFETFHQLYPKVKLNVVEGGVLELCDLLINKQLDIVVAPVNNKTKQVMDVNDIEYKTLFHDEYIAIISSNHPLSSKSKISIHDLSNEQFILY